MREPQDRRRSVKDILAAAKPVERSVTICVAGDLNAQIEDLERELQAAAKRPHTSLASSGDERALAEQIEALRERMSEHEVTFTFRALSSRAWSDLMARHPGRRELDEAFNVDTIAADVIASCAVDPEMTIEDADSLADVLNNAQFGALFECAWRCNTKALDVPFSVIASRVLRDSETS